MNAACPSAVRASCSSSALGAQIRVGEEPADAPTIEAMKRLAAQYPRYGYRRIRIFLRREGFT